MKPLSIKANVTVWYTSLLVVVLSMALAGVLYFSDYYMVSKAKNALEDTVIANASEVDVMDGAYDLSHLEHFDNGVRIIVHQSDGALLFGHYPSGFPENQGWANVEVRLASSGDNQWLYYDHVIKVSDSEQIVVRGIRSVDQVIHTISTTSIAALALFPVLILFAALGGYRITSRALRPVRQITEIASDINEGGDLSRRIGTTEFTGSGDEITTLAETFDAMFARLQASFERERHFAADASHELRTPTAIIMSQAEYGLSPEATPEDKDESLRVVLGQSQKMSRLISQLLLIARTENPEARLNLECFDFSELAGIVATEMERGAKDADIHLRTEIEPGLMVRADHLLMTRLLVNLLSNGIKYGKAGGSVTLRLVQEGESLKGQVADDGIGIGKESIDKVWDRFYRADAASACADADSTGLGLPIAKWIVEVHGGAISLQSTPDVGTTVTFVLPLQTEKN